VADNLPHALYRFYDAANILLYVGITIDPGVRFKKHYADKPWWSEIANIKIEPFPDRVSVLEAERDAIWKEQPIHNIVHSAGATAIRKAAFDEFDEYGRLLVSTDPAWRALALAHPQLLILEKWISDFGQGYMGWYWSESYVCGQAFWYGFGNAREYFGSPYLSAKTLVGALAGWDAGEPVTDRGMAECSQVVYELTKGFMRNVIADGWNAPDALRTEDAYRIVYERMYALTPRCHGQCHCKPAPETGE
jgi:hypothetical protein